MQHIIHLAFKIKLTEPTIQFLEFPIIEKSSIQNKPPKKSLIKPKNKSSIPKKKLLENSFLVRKTQAKFFRVLTLELKKIFHSSNLNLQIHLRIEPSKEENVT